jgi:hypothetical protein
MRWGDLVCVQAPRDVSRGVALSELCEDAAHDLRLLFDNLKFTRAPENRPIAVSLAAHMPSRPNDALQSANDVHSQIVNDWLQEIPRQIERFVATGGK